MITCTKENGTYKLSGILPEDLDILQEAIIRLFNESNKAGHRDFRSQILRINRAIDPEIEKNLKQKNQ